MEISIQNVGTQSNKPTKYATKVKCPTLLLYGRKDKKVKRKEVEAILKNLNCPGEFVIFNNSGHENYLTNNAAEWKSNIIDFLDK